jgi:hypothetical protein
MAALGWLPGLALGFAFVLGTDVVSIVVSVKLRSAPHSASSVVGLGGARLVMGNTKMPDIEGAPVIDVMRMPWPTTT